MIRAENYEYVSKSVKVMPRILWPLFPHTVYVTQWTLWAYPPIALLAKFFSMVFCSCH